MTLEEIEKRIQVLEEELEEMEKNPCSRCIRRLKRELAILKAKLDNSVP